METRITKLLGSKYPMIQGGMAWIAESTLASAVSNAGAVGLIAGGSAPLITCGNRFVSARKKRRTRSA